MEYLLDSDIIIYAVNGDLKTLTALKKLKKEFFYISVLQYFEVLVGTKTEKEEKLSKAILDNCVPLDLNREIILESVRMQKTNPKKIKFKDLLIAATAKVEKLTLVTADKDFKKLKGLKVQLFKGPLQ